MRHWIGLVMAGGALAALSACDDGGGAMLPNQDPFPSTYTPYPSGPFTLTNARVLTGRGDVIENGEVTVAGGRIVRVGPAGKLGALRADVIDVGGATVTPGIIDIHSHLGVYPSPGFASTADGNEATAPNTAGVRAENSVWPQDPGFSRALAGGVTSLMILPGSANLFGGRAVTLKNVPSRTVQGMKFPGAPFGMKMACGENPKRVYGDKGGPQTRMGNFEGYREGFQGAKEYAASWKAYANDPSGPPPARDLSKETIAAALDGEILVHMHCYRGDEMAQVIDMAEEFGYRISAFHHGVEAYKIADLLAEEGICGAVWADWYGFKLEAYDAVPANAALIHAQPGGCAVIHSDSALGIQRLNQEAAKAMRDGIAAGIDIRPEEAIMWITSNPAKAMGIGGMTGSIQTGKMADLVVWDGDPFSVYAKPSRVYIDGALLFDADDSSLSPRSDFELAQRGMTGTGGAGQ